MKIKHEATVPVENSTAGAVCEALGKLPPAARVEFKKGRWKDQRDFERDYFLVTWETNE